MGHWVRGVWRGVLVLLYMFGLSWLVTDKKASVRDMELM